MGKLWSPMAWIDNTVTFLEDTVFLEVTAEGIKECGLEPSTFMFHASLSRRRYKEPPSQEVSLHRLLFTEAKKDEGKPRQRLDFVWRE